MEAIIGTIITLFLFIVFLRIDSNVIKIKEMVSRIEEKTGADLSEKKEKK